MRPAGRVLLPTWMTPLRKVPVVRTTALEVIRSPALHPQHGYTYAWESCAQGYEPAGDIHNLNQAMLGAIVYTET